MRNKNQELVCSDMHTQQDAFDNFYPQDVPHAPFYRVTKLDDLALFQIEEWEDAGTPMGNRRLWLPNDPVGRLNYLADFISIERAAYPGFHLREIVQLA